MNDFYQFKKTSTWTLVRREVMRVIRLWRQTILPSVITTVLYFSIFGMVLGSRVGLIDGVRYVEFVAPGLVMLSVVTNSYGNTAFSVFIDRFHRWFEELLSSPLTDHQIIFGFLMGSVFRGVLCGLVVWLTTICYLGFSMEHPILFIFANLLTAVVFSMLGLVNGLVARSFDDLNVMTTFLLNPLVMLGGVFYSITMLSPFWQKAAMLNPLLYVSNLFRFCMLGTSNINSIIVISVLFGLMFFLYGLTLWLMRSTNYVRQ
jgi:ABC-2 type transport system permease protein